uniref:Uncharacterized protein n=1 Tax=Lotharella globosa TaxID=91324 RepID=A0A7S3Y8V6_9EUKA
MVINCFGVASYTLKNIEANIKANAPAIAAHGGKANVKTLDWTTPQKHAKNLPKKIDFIIASDVVWVDWLVAPLVATLHYLVNQHNQQASPIGDDDPAVPNSKPEKEVCEMKKSSASSRHDPGRKKPLVLLAHQTRSTATDNHLWKLLSDGGFRIAEVNRDRHHPKFRADKIKLFELHHS